MSAYDCRICGISLRNEKEINGNKMMVANANYKEITIEFEDGSAHETIVCRGCAKKSMDKIMLQSIYDKDIVYWLEEDPAFDPVYLKFLQLKKAKSMKCSSRYQST